MVYYYPNVKQIDLLVLLLLIFFLTGCYKSSASVSDTTTPEQATQQPEQTVTPSQINSSPTLSSTSTIPADIYEKRNSYTISAIMDYDTKIVEVNETISYFNQASGSLSELIFAVDALQYENVFNLETIKIAGEPIEEFMIGRNWIKVALPDLLAHDQSIDITIIYQLKLKDISIRADDQKPRILGYSDLQINLVDWYPFLPPITEEGNWLLHEPGYFGEYLVYDLAEFTLKFELKNEPQGTIIASSTGNLLKSGNEYLGMVENARNITLSISTDYLVSEGNYKDITIYSYYFPNHKSAGEEVLKDTIEALRVYSELFGLYPKDSLTIVEADFLDGMEYDGLYFLSNGFYNLYEGTPKSYLTMIAAHETAHQWWYAQVGNDQALDPWLDEGLSTYCELLFYEEVYPDLVNWWWEYRVNFYDPTGTINQSIYDYKSFIDYRNATYLRGAQFLQVLRLQMGDDLFFHFLQSYFKENRFSIATSQKFLSLLDHYVSMDLSSTIESYFK